MYGCVFFLYICRYGVGEILSLIKGLGSLKEFIGEIS